jgi:hypothetical protein
MMGNGYIQIDEASLKRLNLNYKDFVNKVLKNAKFGLTNAALEIVTESQKKIKKRKIWSHQGCNGNRHSGPKEN